MILLDFNQIAISTIISELNKGSKHYVEAVVNYVDDLKDSFSDYGDIVICSDGQAPWRKLYFPNYKKNRKKAKAKSKLDWDVIHGGMDSAFWELKHDYQCMKLDACEADDIIAWFCMELRVNPKELGFDATPDTVIVASDKDFIQLHCKEIKQYDPRTNDWVKHVSPGTFLTDLILYGDRGDGIPNVLSDINCLVDHVRQRPMTKNRYHNLMENGITPEIRERYIENRTLIDFRCIPENILRKISYAYKEACNATSVHQ